MAGNFRATAGQIAKAPVERLAYLADLSCGPRLMFPYGVMATLRSLDAAF